MNNRLPSSLSQHNSLLFLFSLLLITAIQTPTPSFANHPSIHFTQSNPSSSHTVTIDSVNVRPDSSFQLAIKTSDLTDAGISSFDIVLSYDASLITATGATLDGTLSGPDGAGMALFSNVSTPGTIMLAAAGADAITGAGDLVILTFESLSEAGVTEIAFTKLSFNEGEPQLEGVAGNVSVEPILIGDPSLNQEISSYDASLVLQHMVGMTTLTDDALIAGETSGNGSISAYDASLILRYSIGSISCFPAEPSCSASKHTEAAAAQLKWNTSSSHGDATQSLHIDQIQGSVQAITVDLNIHENDIQELTSLAPAGWIMTSAQLDPDTYRILLAGSSPLESDALFSLSLNGASHSLQASYQLNEEPFIPLQAEDPVQTPSSYALLQNYPNPFNPSTTIQYSLPEETQVTIAIYNVLGREIKRLVSEFQAAGTHTVSFDATDIASGTYLYRIETPNYSSTRQMLLIK